jgi:hypothetical protein
MAVERGEGQLRHEVDPIGDTEGFRDHLVIGADECWVSRARAGVGVGRRVLDARIRREVQGQQRRQGPSQAVTADGHRADRLREGEGRQCGDDARRIGRDSYPERIVHGCEAVIRVAGPRQKRAVYLEEIGVVDPLQNPFRAANRDHDVSGPGRLEDQPDRDRVGAPGGVHVRREVVRIDCGNDRVGRPARDSHHAGGIGEVGRCNGIGRINELCELNGLVQVHKFLTSLSEIVNDVWLGSPTPSCSPV